LLTFHLYPLSFWHNQAVSMVLITTLKNIYIEDVQGIPMANYLPVEAKQPENKPI
jgi:hypothetical protein